jgi:rhomboid protease GluP
MFHRYQSPQNNGSPDQPPQTPPPGVRRVAVQMPLSEPRLTYVLLAVIVLIGLYMFTLSAGARIQFLTDWAKINEAIRDGEYFRLFTSMFLHLNLTHLVFNGYALYVLGRDVESLFGTARFALIYFLGGLSGALASFVFTSAPSVGASGAIFAIFGAEMVYFYQHRDLHGAVGQRHLQQLFFIMLLNLGLGFFSTTGATSFRIDNAGHIGGLIGGLVLAWFIGPAYRVHRDPEMEGGLTVFDENPIERWALPSLLYTVGLVTVIVYAVTA